MSEPFDYITRRIANLERLVDEYKARDVLHAAYVARIKQSVIDAFTSVDQEQSEGKPFDNPLLVVSSRIALAWIDLEKRAEA